MFSYTMRTPRVFVHVHYRIVSFDLDGCSTVAVLTVANSLTKVRTCLFHASQIAKCIITSAVII